MGYLNKNTRSLILIILVNIIASILFSIILLKIIKSKKLLKSSQSEKHLVSNMNKGFLIDFYLSEDSCKEDYSQIDIYDSVKNNKNCKCKIENYNSIIDLYYKDNNCDVLKKNINKIIISFNDNVRKNKENYNVECQNDNQIMINACIKYSEYKYIDVYKDFISNMILTNYNYSYYIENIMANNQTDSIKNAIVDVEIEEDKVYITRINDILTNKLTHNSSDLINLIKKSIGSIISDVFTYTYPIFKIMNNEFYNKNKKLYKFSENLRIDNTSTSTNKYNYLYNIIKDSNDQQISNRKLGFKTFPFCEFSLNLYQIYLFHFIDNIYLVYILWMLSIFYMLVITYISFFFKSLLKRFIFKVFYFILMVLSCIVTNLIVFFMYLLMKFIYKDYRMNVKVCEGIRNVFIEYYYNVFIEYSVFIEILTLLMGIFILSILFFDDNFFLCREKKGKENEVINF